MSVQADPSAAVVFEDIQAARVRINDAVYTTPCPESIPLSDIANRRINCKLEYLQRTGSFKERGARNALELLGREERIRGVIAASAGNHGLGLAYHGALMQVPVTVVMPRFAPLMKVTACRRLGAKVLLYGDSFAEARARAEEWTRRESLTYIHGFDDPAVIAGQGTIALEILEQVPDVEAIIVPVGGGGLIAGVSLATKSVRPDVQVIGVTAENAPGFIAALDNGRPWVTEPKPTLADGLAVDRVGNLSFSIARRHVDEVVTVDESGLALAIFRLIELEKSIVEGAGAAGLAACLDGQLAHLAGRRTVLILSGGNIDLNIVDRVIEHGLVADGRLYRFTAVISDRPGGLAKLADLIASVGASVKDIAHDRAFSGPDVATVRAICVVETADHSHIDQLLKRMRRAGVTIISERSDPIR